MGAEAMQQARVKLVCGIIAVNEEVLLRAEKEAGALFGQVELASDIFPFTYTDYYAAEMGQGLLRRFVSFRGLADPAELADIKIAAGGIERKLATESGGRLRRRANLDPGYVTASKLVLATTKNFSHRIYLQKGIYAEVTLNFSKDGCRFFDWTYPDFRSGSYTPFLLEVRRRAMAETGGRES